MPAIRRPLTANETALARRLYGHGLDYRCIRLCSGTWWLPRNGVAMAPCGHIHFPATAFCSDFASQGPAAQAWLIHELAHVWQHQNGFPVWLGGLRIALSGGYLNARAYRLPDLATVPHFSRLNMEQQADLLRNCFLALHHHDPRHQNQLPHYRRLLRPFFANPQDHRLLPAW